jgi:hypothetical protein
MVRKTEMCKGKEENQWRVNGGVNRVKEVNVWKEVCVGV